VKNKSFAERIEPFLYPPVKPKFTQHVTAYKREGVATESNRYSASKTQVPAEF
jgi:hypothetical protein